MSSRSRTRVVDPVDGGADPVMPTVQAHGGDEASVRLEVPPRWLDSWSRGLVVRPIEWPPTEQFVCPVEERQVGRAPDASPRSARLSRESHAFLQASGDRSGEAEAGSGQRWDDVGGAGAPGWETKAIGGRRYVTNPAFNRQFGQRRGVGPGWISSRCGEVGINRGYRGWRRGSRGTSLPSDGHQAGARMVDDGPVQAPAVRGERASDRLRRSQAWASRQRRRLRPLKFAGVSRSVRLR